MKTLNKKGQVGGLSQFVTAIVGVTVVLVIGFIVLTELRTTVANCSGTTSIYNETDNTCWNEYNNVSATPTASSGTASATTIIGKMATIPNWIGIVIVVSLAGVVLALFSLRRG